MFVTIWRCWWQNLWHKCLNVGDRRLSSKKILVSKTPKTVINIIELLPTHFVSHICHQYRCSRHWRLNMIWKYFQERISTIFLFLENHFLNSSAMFEYEVYRTITGTHVNLGCDSSFGRIDQVEMVTKGITKGYPFEKNDFFVVF